MTAIAVISINKICPTIVLASHFTFPMVPVTVPVTQPLIVPETLPLIVPVTPPLISPLTFPCMFPD